MRNPLGKRSAAAGQREDAFFAIVNAEIFVWDAFQEALLKAGSPVGVGRFIPLHFLAEGPMRLNELAERTHTKESAACRLVERMVKDGLVSKERDGGDRRAVVLKITDEGRRVERAGRVVFAHCLEDLFTDLQEDELDALVTLLARVSCRQSGAGA